MDHIKKEKDKMAIQTLEKKTMQMIKHKNRTVKNKTVPESLIIPRFTVITRVFSKERNIGLKAFTYKSPENLLVFYST